MKLFFENIRQKISLAPPLWNTLPQRWRLLLKVLIFICLSAPLIATRHPLMIVYKNNLWFPAFSSLISSNRVESIELDNGQFETIEFEHTNWKTLKSSVVIWAPIPWSANVPDTYNRNFKSPFERHIEGNSEMKDAALPLFFRHHLGTDALGNDVLSGLIHGLGNSVFIAVGATLIALFIGLLLGLTSGYWGNYTLRRPFGSVIAAAAGVILGFFWAFQMRLYALTEAAHEGFVELLLSLMWSVLLFTLILGVFLLLGHYLSQLKLFEKHIRIPFDGAIQRFTETFNALPKLLLILTISAAFDTKNIMLLVLILGSLQWTGIARLARIETMKLRKMPFVETALLQGYSTRRILLVHVLPSVIGVVMVEAIFLFAGSVLVESSLSFLGLGLPDSSYTLGTLLKNGRNHPTAWWMTVFPGVMIFILTFTASSLGKWLQSNYTRGAETYQNP